jgi:hypothetical protein
MPKNPAILLAICLPLGACKRSEPAASPAAQRPVAPPQPPELPEAIAGFAAGALSVDGRAVKRQYSRPGVAITVTLARLPMNPEQYAAWVKTSTEEFPQAVLDVAEDRGNGFYQCDDRGRCDLLIQLRSGVHVELRGGGTSTRGDVNAIARELPLRRLADESSAPQPATPVSFRRDVAPVLASNCATADGCHGPDGTQRVHLDLRAGAAYAGLVGRPSELREGAVRVDPGNPARSFIVDKLTGKLAAKGEGRPMPLDPVTGDARNPNPVEGFVWKTLVAWIAQGAANN